MTNTADVRVRFVERYIRVVDRFWSDTDFAGRLEDSPLPALAECGLEVPPGVQVRLVRLPAWDVADAMRRWFEAAEIALPLPPGGATHVSDAELGDLAGGQVSARRRAAMTATTTQPARKGGLKFRPGALKKLGAPPALDTPVQLGRPYDVLALLLLVVLIIAAAFWGGLGSVPRTISAAGVLTHREGSFELQSPTAGQITRVFVDKGAQFATDTPMFEVRLGSDVQVIRSISGGRVTAVLGKVGQIISAGTELAIVERIKDADDPLMAAVYVAGDKIGQIHPGQQVTLSVQSAPAQKYGLLEGTVSSVGQFPEAQGEISEFLGDSHLGTQFTTGGQPWKVLVRLAPAGTPSGFRWTTGVGPPFGIESRTTVDADFHLPPLKPIDWLVAR
ncbi:HlyD family secretion protein [Streptomyces sp. Ag109_O5-1]|uniref:HlyD family efflux transporter periplasmic adaptor subunit n=1 Tax=Streptomyces sp. Ag109_O5-1 TaxID=1938851 RepID=UPI000F5135C3|nr:HlyD family efflux transporter periplasmic adaptor subunit [Streptomyces sp. Ag109_O5-1]RPE39104.1 HlyD family secretion protein [Streptomyces sp. Ag109_O5-1]